MTSTATPAPLDTTTRAVSVAQVAGILGVPRSTVSGWITRGVIPSFKVGGRRLVRVADVQAMLAPPEVTKVP